MMSGPCDAELLTPERMGNPVHVGRYFIGPDFGPFFTQDIYEFDGEDTAVAALDLARNQLDCEGWTTEDPATGMEMEYSVEELAFPSLGDDTVAVSLNISVASEAQAGAQPVQQSTQFDDLFGDIGADAVLVRQGNVMSSFTYMNWFGDNDLNLEEMVTIAVEQIENAQ
jgi:hypothetical protein